MRRRHHFDGNGVGGPERVDDFGDELLGRGGPGGDAKRPDAGKPAPGDITRPLDEVRLRAALALGNLDEAQRVRRIGRTDDEQRIDAVSDCLDRGLPVGRRVADVLLRGACYRWKPAPMRTR